MSKMLSAFQNSWHFVSKKIWHMRLDKVDKRQGLLIRQLRILSLAVRGFHEDNCLTKATALTFYTLFSIVPILALAFAISTGFGFEKNLQELLSKNYPEYKDLLDNAFVSAGSLLARTQGGLIAGVGTVLLLWSVLKLLVSVEASFNDIWEIKKGRSWVRKITDYLTVMMIGPIFLIVAGGLTVAIQTKIGNIHLLGFLGTFFVKLLAYGLVASLFIFIYMVLPNTRVNFKSAAGAALITTVLFELLQWAYLKFQIGASQMNAIYGGFAALPLFFIWVQYSWYVVLFGAEIAFAEQNVDNYELENEISTLSVRYKKVISLMIANLVAREFYNGARSLTAVQIAHRLDLPAKLARNIISEFTEAGIFVEIKTDPNKDLVYQPGVTESRLTVKYLLDTLEKHGVNSLPINDTSELIHINELMREMDKSLDNDLGNALVRDIVK